MADQIPSTTYGGAAPTPKPAPVGRPGYDFDPYDTQGERAEGFFIGRVIGKFTGESDGFCSTYREWHIMLAGISAGFKAPTFGQVPDCPPLWQDESQYFNTPAMVANVIKCQWPAIVLFASGKLSGVV